MQSCFEELDAMFCKTSYSWHSKIGSGCVWCFKAVLMLIYRRILELQEHGVGQTRPSSISKSKQSPMEQRVKRNRCNLPSPTTGMCFAVQQAAHPRIRAAARLFSKGVTNVVLDRWTRWTPPWPVGQQTKGLRRSASDHYESLMCRDVDGAVVCLCNDVFVPCCDHC
jgi:hypothetical protein